MRALRLDRERRSALQYISCMICTSKVDHLFLSILFLVGFCMASNRGYSPFHTRALTMFPFLGISIIFLSVTSLSLVQRQAQISNIRILPATFKLPNPTASTVLPENTLPPASLSILPTSPFNVSSNVTNVLNTTEAYLSCSYALGQGLTIDSCYQAHSELRTWLDGLTRSYITIGEPTYGVWDVDDRITFLSCECTQKLCGFWITDERETADRICAFDFRVLLGGEDGQVATYDLAHASNQLMLRCVTRPGDIAGGSYDNLGNLRPHTRTPETAFHGFPYNPNIR